MYYEMIHFFFVCIAFLFVLQDEEIIDVQQAAMANAAASDAHLSLPEQNDQWRHKADNVEINRSPIHAG